jgi:hypothetical protein
MQESSTRRKRLLVSLAAAAVVAGAWMVLAGGAKPGAGRQAAGAAAPGETGMRVAVEPETRELVPDVAAPSLGIPADAASDLAIRTRPDGGRYVVLRGHFENYTIVQRTGDGRLVQMCTSDPTTLLAGQDATRNAAATPPETDARGWEVR